MKKQTPHDQFKDHKIKRQDERSLLLERPDDPNMWCTIAIDDYGQIVVFGDFGPMVFGTCAVPFTHRIEWLGSHEEVDDYVLQKARNGMSGFASALTKVTWEDFESDARQALADRLEQLGDHTTGPLRTALTWEAFEPRIADGGLDRMEWSVFPAQRALHSYLDDLGYQGNWAWISKTGQRPISAVGLAHAALRRAHLLLKADEVPFV